MEPGQSLLTQRRLIVGEVAENRGQVLLMLLVILTAARLTQQPVVKRPAFRRQRNASLLNFPEARSVGARMSIMKDDRFFKRPEAGLTQQDRHLTTWRPLDQRFRIDAARRHQLLDTVDIQRARRKMVDVAAGKADHIGDQAMLLIKRLIGLTVDRAVSVPAKRFQRFGNKGLRLVGGEAALLLMHPQQRPAAGSKNVTRGENRCRLLAQRGIVDQFRTQQ